MAEVDDLADIFGESSMSSLKAQLDMPSIDRDSESTRSQSCHNDSVISAHITSLRLLFTAWLSHFRSLGYIKETTMEMLDKTVLRKILQLSVRSPPARLALGSESNIWSDLLSLLRVAIPSIESRSYATIPDPYDTSANPLSTVYDGPSANVVVDNSPTLLRDLQRLNNILCIGRNILTAGVPVQNLAAQTAVDREVCCLVNLCVKVTARGYDGDGTASDEERWQAVINEYKKLLITCLQFLSNLITLNERLKLMLWVELFDPASEGNVPPYPDPAGAVRPPQPGMEKSDRWVANKIDGFQDFATGPPTPDKRRHSNEIGIAEDYTETQTNRDEDYEGGKIFIRSVERARSRTPVSGRGQPKPVRPQMAYFMWLDAQKENVRLAMRERLGKESPMVEVVAEATRMWERLPPEGKEPYNEQYNQSLESWKQELESWRAAGGRENVARERDLSQRRAEERWRRILGDVADANDGVEGSRGRHAEDGNFGADFFDATSTVPSVQRPMESAEEGIRKLEEGKTELLKRLEHNASIPTTDPNALSPASPIMSPIMSPASPTDSPPQDQPPDTEGHVDDEDEEIGEDLDADPNLDSEEDEEEEDGEEGEEGDGEEDESSSDDYDRIPGEDGRGLLTDIPLILGPNEIEVLPMIIMSGIVCDPAQIAQRKAQVKEASGSTGSQGQSDSDEKQVSNTSLTQQAVQKPPNEALQTLLNMYTIRCHLLLAQENGRNLLRELLIFVAAWDLREEELYFKFMVKIMESILLHGLMPFAYNAFKESKDVISPAQAVIMKLLTKIFHARGAFAGGAYAGSGSGDGVNGGVNADGLDAQEHENSYYVPPNWPTNRDGSLATSGISYTHPVTGEVHLDPTRAIVSSLIAEFRSSIIPQICALIFLQGQIRRGKASLDDFPLNLWDMERMYEGVYQYLEFFAILTDCEEWKGLLAGWEIVSELVTLLRELEMGIGKGGMSTRPMQQFLHQRQQGENQALNAHASTTQQSAPQTGPTPVAIERPYSPLHNVAGRVDDLHHTTLTTHPQTHSLPLPTPPSAPPDGSSRPPTQALPSIPGDVPPTLPPLPSVPLPPHEEPALFEWRNLKKLCVLVLSSLVWKNKTLQDQMLRFGGVEAVLRCCQHVQGNNPDLRSKANASSGINVDEHNPYIREHAIMCLRFCCEGNIEVQNFIRDIVARSDEVEKMAKQAQSREGFIFERDDTTANGAGRQSDGDAEDVHDINAEDILQVPPEVLDAHGYETFMDHKGQVGLRRKKSSRLRTAESTNANSRENGLKTSTSISAQKSSSATTSNARRQQRSNNPATHLNSSAEPRYFDQEAENIYESHDDITAEAEGEDGVGDADASEAGVAEYEDVNDIPAALRPGNGHLSHAHVAALVEEKPRTAADLPGWVERITRDLPHRRLERERAQALALAREQAPTRAESNA